MTKIPYRIDLAGGWCDQPFISKLYPGSVIVTSIEPTIEFNNRSGMASSTHRKAIEIWGDNFPITELEKNAKILFCCDNPPGTINVSGSQDSIGIVYPNLNKINYDGEYWPYQIDTVKNEEILQFIENSLYLIPLGPRGPEYDVMINTNFNESNAKDLSIAAESCWGTLLNKNIEKFGNYINKSFEAQIKMFPNMVNNQIKEMVNLYKDKCLGYKLSGAGGGGYLILVSDKEIENSIKIKIRRN